MTALSVLFVNYNSWQVLVEALRSLLRHAPKAPDGTPLAYEVIVVDNASPIRDDAAEAEIRKLLAAVGPEAGHLILHDQNGGYASGMNLAYAKSSGHYVLVSNPDVEFNETSIEPLIAYLEAHPECGVAAPEGFWDDGFECRLPPNILPTRADLWRLTLAGLSPRRTRAYSRRRTADALRVWEADAHVDLDMVSGCCFLMTRPFIEQIGLFDEQFPLYYEDTDLSMRVRQAGKRIVQVHPARIVHLYNRSGQTDHSEAMARYWTSRRRYYRKWYGRLGARFYDATRKILTSRFGEKRGRLPPQPRVHDLGSSNDPPVVRMPQGACRYLIEISLDPHFYLCAGVLGEGESWTPGPRLFANFGPAVYFFRVVDRGSKALHELGVFRYERVYPPEWAESSSAAGTAAG